MEPTDWNVLLVYSLLLGIINDIFKRRCLLPLTCSLEKSQVTRELALIALSLQLAWRLNEIHKIGAENELPHFLSQLGFSCCCLPFVSVFLHMYTSNCIHLIVKILYITTLQYFNLSLDHSWRRLSFLSKEWKLSKKTICRGVCTFKSI